MILFYLLVSVMPLVRHPLWSEFVGDLTVIKALGTACLGYAMLHLLLNRDGLPRFFATAQASWFALFAALAMGSFVALGVPQPLEVSPLLSHVSFLLLFFVTLVVVDSLPRLRWVLLMVVGSAAYASLHVMREWQKYGLMSAGYRPGWVTGDPNYYSVSALLCLPVAFHLLRTKQPTWERWFCVGSLVVTLFGLTLAASRGAFLGLLASSLLVAWRSPRRGRTLGTVGLILLPLLLVAPSSPLDRLLNPNRSDQQSAEARTAVWSAGLRMVREHPLTGIGTGNFKPLLAGYAVERNTPSSVAHNTYLEIAAEIGLPGLVAFLGILFCTFRSLGRLRRATRGAPSSLLHQAAEALQVGLVGYAVAIFFLSAEDQKLFWLVVFLSMCVPPLAARAASVHPRSQTGRPATAAPDSPTGNRGATALVPLVLCSIILAWPIPVRAGEPDTASAPLDRFGGLPLKVGDASGYFKVRKTKDRWTFVTPEGNAFWMRAVYVVSWGDGGGVASDIYRTRYKGDNILFTNHANKRLKAWGFNAVGPYSLTYALPVPTNFRTSGNPTKLPFIRLLNVSWYGALKEPNTDLAKWGLAPAPFKTLLTGAVDSAIYTGWPGHVPDVFDPNFETFARNLAADLKTPHRQTVFTQKTSVGGLPHPSLVNSPWLIGTAPDDVDYFFGLGGPGPEVPGINGVIHPHLGWVVAVTPPTQTQNTNVGKAFGLTQTVAYSDPVAYSKRAWRDFLAAKYGTIAALNAAWGATYTTFDSDGGWPTGNGLMDENGRHAWLKNFNSTNQYGGPVGSGTYPQVKADLDAFLERLADRYFSVVTGAVRAATPNHLVFGPAMLNGHKGLSRRQILRSAGRYCDVLEVNHNWERPELLVTTYEEAGGKPMFTWTGTRANRDSAMHMHSPGGIQFPTQEERGANYRRQVEGLLGLRAKDGVRPMVGLAWWEYMDKAGEQSNWGLVTPLHNAYDGKEAVRAPGVDRWGYPTGGESRDFGDLLSTVRQTNVGTLRQLEDELKKATAPRQ